MPRRVKVCQKAISSVIERLEERCLLTTIMGGGEDPQTGAPLPNQFTYQDANNHIVVITVGGNTTAEFIGGRVPPMMGPGVPNSLEISDLVLGVPPDQGIDLFSIYVSDSNSRSYITVTQIDPNTGRAIPFTGNAGDFRVRTPGGSRIIQPEGGTGQIILGARTKDITPGPDENIPFIAARFSGAFGVRPASRFIPAGFEVAPGHDFGKFLFGGVVTGLVTIPGSMESFYAGNVWTGDARGGALGGAIAVNGQRRRPNFTIGGNLSSLLVAGSIGTNSTDDDPSPVRPDYATGFDMQVGGILGQINARGSIIGGVNVIHGRAGSTFGANIAEVEGLNLQSDPANDPAAGWFTGMLEGSASVLNDTFDTPQILDSFVGRKRGRTSVVVNGQLVADPIVNDFVDYYAIAMMAGESATVALRPLGTLTGNNSMNMGIFDPDGRLIATDIPNFTAQTVNVPVHFTADRPGLYRIAVAPIGDPDFNGSGVPIGISPYVVTITNAGDIALGGVAAGNNVFDGQFGGYGFYVQNGDMGAFEVGGNMVSLTDQTVTVRKGDLRSLEAGEVGFENGNLLGDSPNLFVTRGSVGLVRSTVGAVVLNEGVLAPPIGFMYQTISAAGTLVGEMIANGPIGVIRAGDMATLTPSTITANADQLNGDGIIDLIDVTGDLGTPQAGGPAISTGPGGDVRYMNVGGNVFRDRFFGGGTPEATTYSPGETVHMTDDSGTKIDLEPFPLTPNPLFIPGGTNPAQIGPTLTVTAYPIRGSGGVAVINVTSTGSVRVGAGGGRGTRSHAEIGLISTTGVGNPVIRSTNSGQLSFAFPTGTFDTNAVNLDVLMNGSGTIDVFRIQGSDFTSIRNQTPGEIVNINSTINPTVPPGFTNNGTIGSLEAVNIGTAVSHTKAAVNGFQVIGNAYPFNQQHNGIVSGNILNVQAAGQIGNLNVTGSIGNVTANSGGRHTTGVFEGIVGPIVATDSIPTVDIGDGILPSGTGDFSRAGLYVGNLLGSVVNRGLGSDIRGDIVAGSGIASITLSNGAIIGNRIIVGTPFGIARRGFGGGVLLDSPDTATNPTFELGEVSVGGVGGIIGSLMEAADVGPITVSGFGIVNSSFRCGGPGTIAGLSAQGYGIRGVSLLGGAFINSISASAKPRNIPTTVYTPSVRLSNRYAIDPFFDQAPSNETDLDVYLGTTAVHPSRKRVTDAGAIVDTTASISRNLGSVFAATIRTSQLHVANTISSIATRGLVEGLQLTAGHVKTYVSGSSSSSLNWSVAGPIDSFRVKGDLDVTSRVGSVGPSAHIGTFEVDGNLNGQVTSGNDIDFLAVGGDVGPTALVKAKAIDRQKIGGHVFGTIQIG
jgi:hypothetical protein